MTQNQLRSTLSNDPFVVICWYWLSRFCTSNSAQSSTLWSLSRPISNCDVLHIALACFRSRQWKAWKPEFSTVRLKGFCSSAFLENHWKCPCKTNVLCSYSMIRCVKLLVPIAQTEEPQPPSLSARFESWLGNGTLLLFDFHPPATTSLVFSEKCCLSRPYLHLWSKMPVLETVLNGAIAQSAEVQLTQHYCTFANNDYAYSSVLTVRENNRS